MFIKWDTPIKADFFRSTDLKEVVFNERGLGCVLIEEETEENWMLSFDALQGLRITTEECSARLLEIFPDGGGFFKSYQSTWLSNLGKGDVPFLDDACHFVICCYDEILEVVASENSPQFKKL